MRLSVPTPRRIVTALVTMAILVLGSIMWLSAPRAQGMPASHETASAKSGGLIDDGHALFSDNCASCHGNNGEGTNFGPSLKRAGEASADFMLRTGRMPLSDPSQQATRNTPAFTAAEIQQLNAYVGSLGNGPPIPQFDLRGASLPEGNTLFTINCAPCHGVTGSGDAIGGPAFAPSLSESKPLDVQEAVRVGPGQMPNFSSVLDPTQINDITRYVEYLHEQGDPGGANLGLIGPVPEGFVAWFLGAGVLVIITILFVGKPAHRSTAETTDEEH